MLRLTEARKRVLTNTLYIAYLDGWKGDLKDIKRRPHFSSWERGMAPAGKHLEREGLVRTLYGQGNWMKFLTRKGLDLAEQLFRDNHDGKDARLVAEQASAQRKAEADQRAAEVHEIARNLRGLSVRKWPNKRRALSNLVKEARLEDGFPLKFERDELLELSRQIEKLRA